MGRGGNSGNKQYGKRIIRSEDKGSDESDEDYTLGTDEEFEDSEYCSSFAGEESEESLGEFEEEKEEDKEEEQAKKVGKSKGRKGFLIRKRYGVGQAQKKKWVLFKEENDEDYEDEEEQAKKVGKSKGRKGFLLRKRYGVGKAQKKKWDSFKEENDEDYEGDDYDYDYDYDNDDDDDDDDEEDDDDDDDEEFTPDGFDLDTEDELAVNKKNKKVGRSPLRGKGFVKRLMRRRNSKVTKKPMRKKQMKSCWLKSKSAASNDALFTKKNPVLRKRSEKSSGRRRRRFMSDSDSNFKSSGSSDFEYTTSEEEGEQVREASEFSVYLTTVLQNSSSKKRLREEGLLCQQKKCMGRKGKEKVEDKYEAGKQVCGICLSEEGKKTVRGTLNCCSHYFCFACIMEWSKVESRCPLCKERFVAISKPARSNNAFDLRTMVVEVPERDQVYQPSEEELRGYLGPYENVICTECQQDGDDAFMLLCDLCDSPAHTYCVGLGRAVPEGNWYCEGCGPAALSSSTPQAPSPTLDERTFVGLSGRSSSVVNVRQDIDLNTMYVPETPSTQGTGVFSSPGRSGGDFQAASPLSGGGVVTVSERRRLNCQIRNLLDNIRILPVDRTTRMPATTSGNNLLGFQIQRVREVALQPAITPESLPPHHPFSQGRLQANFSPSIQSMDPFLARSSHSRLQQAGLSGIGMDIDTRLGFEQFHPCSSRSSIGDASMSPRRYRETTVPSASRALQGALRTPF